MAGTSWQIGGNAGTTNPVIGTTDNQPIVVYTSNVERLRIDQSGNLGIGTQTPGYPLDVYNGSGRIYGSLDLAIGTAGIGFNREVATGVIYDASHWGYQLCVLGTGADADAFQVQQYGPDGSYKGSPVKIGTDGNVHVDKNLVANGDISAEGDVVVGGEIRLSGADCAEQFEVCDETVGPGTVVVIDGHGALRECSEAYDKRVAGVVSGAGEFRPAIVLDNLNSKTMQSPVALFGKAYCKVDASYSPIEVGDLLTTSETPGHAMRALEHGKALGSIIGKAMRRIDKGRGLIPILVALQ